MWHTSASWLDDRMTGRKEEVSSKWGQWVLYAVQCTHSSISAKWTGYCKLISELPHPVSQGSNICSTSSGRSNSRLYSWPGSSLYKSWEMLSLYEQPNCAILGPFFPVLTSDKRFQCRVNYNNDRFLSAENTSETDTVILLSTYAPEGNLPMSIVCWLVNCRLLNYVKVPNVDDQ